MKRAIVFSSEYPPHVLGGLGTHVDHITATLADSLTLELFVPARGGYRETPPGIRLHEVAVDGELAGPQFWIDYSRQAAQAAASEVPDADLIHCHDWMTVLAGIKTRELLGRPLAYNVHLPQQFGASHLIENLGLVSADLVLVNSRSVEDELNQRQIPLARMEILPNGVDPAVFHPADDWPEDDGYILFVGRLVPQKGVDTLLSAFSVLLRRCPESRLVIAGDGFFELYFQRLARHLGIPDRVSFLTWQTGEPLIHLYQRARIVVVPSYYEPFGIVALEAMACGRPVVASKVGGLEEIIDQGVQGYLVAAGDHLDMARRLATLMLDADRCRSMGREGREHTSAYTWDRIGSRLLVLYDDLENNFSGARSSDHAMELKRNLFQNLDDRWQRITEDLLGAREGT